MSRTRIRVAWVPLGRSLRRLALALAPLVLGACGGAQKEGARVDETQSDTDRRIEAVRVESEKRAAEAQRQITKLPADVAARSAELERDLRGRPQADAGAEDELANERRSLEERGRTGLRRLDQEAQEIGTRVSSLAQSARAEIERELESASAARKSVEDDLDELERATRETLRPLSERLDRHLAELERSLKSARKKLK